MPPTREGEHQAYQLSAPLRDTLRLNATFTATAQAFETAAEPSIDDDYQRFQISLCLWTWVKELANQVQAGDTDPTLIATLLNAECTLFAINASSSRGHDIALNPFLSHWTDSIVAWEIRLERLLESEKNGRGKSSQARVDGQKHALIARLELLKRLLMEKPFPPAGMSGESARAFVEGVALTTREYEKFDARRWVQVAVGAESLIWENEDAMSTFRSSVAALVPLDMPLERPVNVNDLQRRNADEVFKILQRNPDEVRSALLRMPPDDIKALELFNGLLAMDVSSELVRAGTDTPQLIRDFLQHALRNLESLSEAIQGTARPPSADDANRAPESSSLPLRNAPPGADKSTAELRERLVRAARLVALFVRNLFGKGYVTNGDVAGEMMELVTRYSWVKEVKQLLQFT